MLAINRLPTFKKVVQGTAVNTDVLAGSPLASPGQGVLVILVASTVNTATISVTTNAGKQVDADPVELWANGVPPGTQVPYVIPIVGADKPVIAIGGTTGTWHAVVAFYRV